MASLATVRQALADTIQVNTGLRSYSTIPSSPLTPCVVIEPDTSEPSTFARGRDTYTMTVRVVSGPVTSDVAAQTWLDEAITGAGATSVRQAIYQHPTLGTDVNEATAGSPTMTASITGFREYGVLTLGDSASAHWSAVLTVTVLTRGDS